MKKSVLALLTLLILASMAGSASAGARGYGFVFGVMARTTDGAPILSLPPEATRQ